MSLTNLEKKINSELNTKINSSRINHEQLEIQIDKESLLDVIIFLKKNDKDIDASRKNSVEFSTIGTMFILSAIIASSQILGAALTIIAVSISLPIYWGERRLKVLISYVIGFPLFVIVLFNIILGVHFEPGLLELIKN